MTCKVVLGPRMDFKFPNNGIRQGWQDWVVGHCSLAPQTDVCCIIQIALQLASNIVLSHVQVRPISRGIVCTLSFYASSNPTLSELGL
jgi:hypothetical protein